MIGGNSLIKKKSKKILSNRENKDNTSLAAPGALAYRLQRHTACNTSPPT